VSTDRPPTRSTRTVRVRSRWDDSDRYGHVNNAAYLAIIRAAHDRAGLAAGELRALEITYRQPVPPETMIDIEVTVHEDGASHMRVAYALRVDGRAAADATALWQVAEAPLDNRLPPIHGDAGGRPFRFRQAVRSYELGPTASARPQAIVQWIEHAVFGAVERAGWPRARMEAAGFVTLVIGHHLVLGVPGLEGDELTVTSRLIELRRVSGTWHHEVHRQDGALVAADRARGAFLDLDGRLRPAPAGMLDDLLRGEPTD
jgi:acyl-CoA thioesterase FadM